MLCCAPDWPRFLLIAMSLGLKGMRLGQAQTRCLEVIQALANTWSGQQAQSGLSHVESIDKPGTGSSLRNVIVDHHFDEIIFVRQGLLK